MRSAILLACLLVVSANSQAFQVFENFDTNPSSRWTNGSVPGAHTTFQWVPEGSGGHLRVVYVRDGISAKYTCGLPSAVTIGSADKLKHMYYEVDVQIAGGVRLGADGSWGLGNSAGTNFQSVAFWNISMPANQASANYNAGIFGSTGVKTIVNVTGITIIPGDCLRLRYELAYDEPNDIVFATGSAWTVRADGSTERQLFSARTMQDPNDPNKITSLTTDIFGFFSSDMSALAGKYIAVNFDNFYVSDSGFNAVPVLPSWMQFKSGYELLDTFSSLPTQWSVDADPCSRGVASWVSSRGDGYLDVLIWRENIRWTYTRPIGTAFTLDGLENTLGWYFQFDVKADTPDAQWGWGYNQVGGFIGTGFSQAFPPKIWNDLDVAYFFPYNNGTHFQLYVGGFDDFSNGGLVNQHIQVADLSPWPAVAADSYRIKCAVAYDTTPVICGKVYRINPDGTDGNLIPTPSLTYTRAFGSVTAPMYADIIGFFTMKAAAKPEPPWARMFVDNFYVSNIGFPLESQIPTWMITTPLCSETQPMVGDFGSEAGAGLEYRDCVVDSYDLKIFAEHWLSILN
jgi:hypothetical protein